MALHLRLIRQARGLSLRQLGVLAGFHRSQLSRIENNHYTPKLDQLETLAKALNVPAALLIAEALPDTTALPPWRATSSSSKGVLSHA